MDFSYCCRFVDASNIFNRGISVGSKIDHQNLLDFISEKKISLKGIMDEKIFSFEDSQAAFDYLYSGKHLGKVIIKI